ncbi:hypothetical protein T265_04639 [Opisthorchis viverrini]|uniref:Uncharacterized protein n=1 Tax=Opisthorchis viverrini TaxID=6198 RepID=A0A074ZNA6_OPIVI|nr:hypothetical protein T265_04639 [Opisthorchis viverrini]KER28596.1 hypothetical protein T265_04639 [Opisthorchis viverrini]
MKHHLPKLELQKIIESELGDDMQKLKEKFLILLVDNYKLREKNTLLRYPRPSSVIKKIRYEVDLHKEELQETSRDLKRLSSFWKEKRRELTFLKRVTQQQEKEIQSLLKTLSKMKENQVKNLEEKGIRPLKGPCSKGGSLSNLAVSQPSCFLRVAWQLGTQRVLQLDDFFMKGIHNEKDTEIRSLITTDGITAVQCLLISPEEIKSYVSIKHFPSTLLDAERTQNLIDISNTIVSDTKNIAQPWHPFGA